MRTIAVLSIVTVGLFGSLASASAQDEEGESEGDIDSLMEGDPERPEPEPEEAADDEEAPPSDAEGEPEAMTDDERPPGEEPAAEAEPEAEGEVEESSDPGKPFSVGLLLGYGHALSSGANPWSAGFGLRGGYNLGGFYVGARFTYYIGETMTVQRRDVFNVVRDEDITANLWELGAEIGYDIRASNTVAVRPEFGVGFASVSANQTETVAYVAPGVALLLDVSEAFFLGLDVRYQYVATQLGESGLGFFANIGMRF